MAGNRAFGFYVSDKGLKGQQRQQGWQDKYEAVLCAPKRNATAQPLWPRKMRQWIADLRQIVESVLGKLHHTFSLVIRLLGIFGSASFAACHDYQNQTPEALHKRLQWKLECQWQGIEHE